MPELEPDGLESAGKPKKKDKERHVWISFFGRILAQIIGAIASVVLGIFVLQKYQPQLPFARVMLVKALLMSGDHAAAVAACDGLNALAGDHTDLLLTCGIALQQRGDPRAAQVLSRRSRSGTPRPATWRARSRC